MVSNEIEILRERWEVPHYSITELRLKQHKYCICVFVINEGERVTTQLDLMRPLAKQIDIIVADGGSTDGSVTKEKLMARDVRTLLSKIGPGRLSAQMRMAFAYALEQGYEGIVVIDGNNKDDPGATSLFIEALDEGYDHVQGSRFMKGGVAVNTPSMRWLGIRLVHAPLISLAARFPYSDSTNGFRAYSRRFLLDPNVAPFRHIFSGYELHYYLAIKAARQGYRVKELPVIRAYPAKGPTPTKISPIKGNILVVKTLLKACLHQFDPPTVSHSNKGN